MMKITNLVMKLCSHAEQCSCCVLQNEHSDEYAVPFDADLECKTHVVVYDGNTTSLVDVCSQC